MMDTYLLRGLVETRSAIEHLSPQRTNAQVGLVKPLQQVTQCRCILGVADARIDTQRYARYAFDGRCAGDVN